MPPSSQVSTSKRSKSVPFAVHEMEMDPNDVNFTLGEVLDSHEIGIFDYNGFDPLKIRSIMENTSGFTKRDLSLLLLYSVKAGFNVSNAARKVGQQGLVTIRELIRKYGVRSSKRNLSRDDSLTMSRLQAAYPVMTSKILYEVGTGSGGGYAGTLPVAYRFSAGVSLLPRTLSESRDLYAAFIEWAVYINGEIAKNMGTEADYQSVEKYAKIAYESGYVPEDVRLALYSMFT